MTQTQTRRTRICALLLALACVWPLLAAHWHGDRVVDDAYITLTYAKNLARGDGFVFNHPPATLGTTTPLFTLAVAGVVAVTHESEAAVAVWLSTACWIALVWTIFLFRRYWGWGDVQALLVALPLVAWGWIGSLGMETYTFAFLLVLSVSLFLSNRPFAAGLTAGLLFVTRGEGALLLPVFLAATTIFPSGAASNRREVVRLVLGFGVVLAAWCAYALVTFGDFLPATLAAKRAQAASGHWRSILTRLARNWMPRWGLALGFGVPFVNLWWPLVAIGVASTARRRPRWTLIAAWTALYVGGYAALGVAAYAWYQLPVVLTLQLFFGVGLMESARWISHRLPSRRMGWAVSTVGVVVLLAAMARPNVVEALSPADAKSTCYRNLARWFNDNADPSESIAYVEVGHLGYFTDNRVVDLMGLVTPGDASDIARGDFAAGFWRARPDYFVYLPDFDWALAGIRGDPVFDRSYRPVARLPGPRGTAATVFRRTGTD